jgi:hypothetical protein
MLMTLFRTDAHEASRLRMSEPFIQYRIAAGQLSSFDSTGTQTYLGAAYSGAPGFVNDPNAVRLIGLGPIPPGAWSIGVPFDNPKTGPFSIPLTPMVGTETFGRSEFLCHGDNEAMDQTASHGCIIAARPIRVIVATFQVLIVQP